MIKFEHTLGLLIGIPALYWMYTIFGFSATAAIFLLLTANNLSQR